VFLVSSSDLSKADLNRQLESWH